MIGVDQQTHEIDIQQPIGDWTKMQWQQTLGMRVDQGFTRMDTAQARAEP